MMAGSDAGSPCERTTLVAVAAASRREQPQQPLRLALRAPGFGGGDARSTTCSTPEVLGLVELPAVPADRAVAPCAGRRTRPRRRGQARRRRRRAALKGPAAASAIGAEASGGRVLVETPIFDESDRLGWAPRPATQVACEPPRVAVGEQAKRRATSSGTRPRSSRRRPDSPSRARGARRATVHDDHASFAATAAGRAGVVVTLGGRSRQYEVEVTQVAGAVIRSHVIEIADLANSAWRRAADGSG